MEHFSLGERLDPRSVNGSSRFGHSLNRLRRYPEAREAFDRGLALVPDRPLLIARKGQRSSVKGISPSAGPSSRPHPKEVEPTVLVAGMANSDLALVLDEAQRELLLRLTPSAFDNDEGTGASPLPRPTP